MAKASTKRPAAAAKSGGKAASSGKASASKGGAKAELKKTTKSKAAPAPVKAAAKAPAAPAKATPVAKVAVAAKANGKAAAPVAAKAAKSDAPVMKAEKSSKRERPEREQGRVVNMVAPVPTDMKPAKNQAGLKVAELEHYRDLLLAKRRELVGDMSSMEREALQRGGSSNLSNLPMHMADMGTDNYEQEFTLGLMEKDRNLLREINSALAKIQDGTFGICEGTGKPIAKPRLEAQPWARFGIEHARKMEQRGVR